MENENKEDLPQKQIDEALEHQKKFTEAEEKILAEAKKPREVKAVTYILMGSKFLVFACFIYSAMVMYKLGMATESIFMAMAISLYIILNKLEGG